MIFIDIIVNIIFPIFFIIGCGILLDRKFKLDLPTLSKLNFYIFVPGLVFIKIIENDVPLQDMGIIILFTVILLAVLFLISTITSLIRRDSSPILTMGAMFSNTGNFGIPLTLLAFGEKYVPVIAIILMTQNLLSFTFGIVLLEKEKPNIKAFLDVFKIPVVIAIILGFIIKGIMMATGWVLFSQIKMPLDFIAGGLIPIALLTLGVQLSRINFAAHLLRLSQIVVLRLLIAPLIAWGMVLLFGFEPELAGMLIVTAGLPVAVNVYILAAEYNNDKELASQAVFWTSVLSVISLSLFILFFRMA